MKKRLKLPVGIENFEEIRRNQYYYIDKTKLIEQLFDSLGKVSLFTRPRRFGKTLNMSMLKSFFEIGTDTSLFDGLYISENKELCEQHQGQYPVIFLSLKDVEGLSFSEAKRRCIQLIKREAERFYGLKNSERLLDIDKKNYCRLPNYQVTDKEHIHIFERLNESATLNMELAKAGIPVKGLAITSEELETYFLNLTGGASHA